MKSLIFNLFKLYEPQDREMTVFNSFHFTILSGNYYESLLSLMISYYGNIEDNLRIIIYQGKKASKISVTKEFNILNLAVSPRLPSTRLNHKFLLFFFVL